MSEEIGDRDKILEHIRMAEFNKALQVIGRNLPDCTAKAEVQLYNLQGIIYNFQMEYGHATEAFRHARELAGDGNHEAARILANNQQSAYTLAKNTGMAADYAREAARYAEEDRDQYYAVVIEYNRLRMQALIDLDRMGMLFSPLSVTRNLNLPAALEQNLTGKIGRGRRKSGILLYGSI